LNNIAFYIPLPDFHLHNLNYSLFPALSKHTVNYAIKFWNKHY